MNFLGLARRVASSSYQITKLLNTNKSQILKLFTARSISLTPQALEESKIDVNEDVNKKLMEFFDDKKNWNENEVKHGRSWKLDELRIKSNTDLHKLWYILLKERNMLKTMEHEYKKEWRYWASPERIDKIEESMSNLETVVRERNKAYYQLEMGHNGERPGRVEYNHFGLKEFRAFEEYTIPKFMNTEWKAEHTKRFGFAVRKFLRLYREKIYLEKKKEKRRNHQHVMRLLRNNPTMSDELIAEKFPDVDVGYLRRYDKVRGHYVPKVD